MTYITAYNNGNQLINQSISLSNNYTKLTGAAFS